MKGKEGLNLETYRIRLDPAAAELYRQVAQKAGLPTEQVLSDALFRLAGSLSLQETAKKWEKASEA